MKLPKREKWAQLREKGPWYFILVVGVGFWGSWMFLFTNLMQPLFGKPMWQHLRIDIPIWIVGGLAFGAMTWTINESLYHGAATKGPPASGLTHVDADKRG